MNIPNVFRNAIFGLLLFARMILKKIRNRAGYSSFFSTPLAQKSSLPKPGLKAFGCKQRGFLTLAAIIIIIVFGLLGGYLASIFIRSSTSSSYLGASKQAAALAESGLELGKFDLTQTVIGSRSTCAALSDSNSLSTGVYSVAKANANDPYYTTAFSTLSTTITAASTPSTITVASTAGFAPLFGRVLIGREVFLYTRVSNGTTLAGVTRALDGTSATLHTSGAIVSQYQCTIQATGSAPDSVSPYPYGVRQYQQDMQQPMLFAVGLRRALNWNATGAAEKTWQDMTISPAAVQNINAVTVTNYHDGWYAAFQDPTGSPDRYRLGRLQGTTWTPILVSAPGSTSEQNAEVTDLFGIYATSEAEAWAVGTVAASGVAANQPRMNILHWLQSTNTWCRVPLAGGTNCDGKTMVEPSGATALRSLLGVKTMDTNNDGLANMGYAVGGNNTTANPGDAALGMVMSYNGTTWTQAPALPAGIGQLRGVDISANATEAFFVGRTNVATTGVLLRYRPPTLARSLTDPSQQLQAVSVIDTNGDGQADFGCAVGVGGLIVTFNGNTPFAIATSTTITGNPTLKGVVVLSPTDIWVVGLGTTSPNTGNAVAYHYEGSGPITASSSWIQSTIPTPSSADFTGVAGVFPNNPSSYWYDLIQ